MRPQARGNWMVRYAYPSRMYVCHFRIVQAWGFLRRDGEMGPVVGRGQYQTNDELGSRGTFVLRPVLVESIITQIMGRMHVQPARPQRAPVELKPLPADCVATMDMTCTICLDDNIPPSDCDSSCNISERTGNSSGMLACGHAFHTECIQTWLNNHDDCPTCKHLVRTSAPELHDTPNDQIDNAFEAMTRNLRPIHLRGRSPYFPTMMNLSGAGGNGTPVVVRLGGGTNPLGSTDMSSSNGRMAMPLALQRPMTLERLRVERRDTAQGLRLGHEGFVTASTGLRQLDTGLEQLEHSLVSLENEVRTMVQRLPAADAASLRAPGLSLQNGRVFSLEDSMQVFEFQNRYTVLI